MDKKDYMKLLVEMTKSENEEQAFEIIKNALELVPVVAIKGGKLLYSNGLQVGQWNVIINEINKMINETVI
jgi:hypothetical protein